MVVKFILDAGNGLWVFLLGLAQLKIHLLIKKIKMKRISTYLGLFLIALVFSLEAEAQLSDRINNPSAIRAGTRPVAGNFGFFLALEADQFEDLFDQQTEVENAIPLINVRYYLQDDLVLRAGISIWKKARSIEGEIDTSSNNNNPFLNGGQGFGAVYEHKEVESYTLLNIGAEKHFKASNLLDGYVGVSLPIGYTRANETSNISGSDGTTDFLEVQSTRFSFVYGAELFVGANAFVADLPLAIGVELGVRGIGLRGDKFRNEYEGSSGGVGFSGEYFTNNIDDFENTAVQSDLDAGGPDGGPIEFSSLSARSFDTQAMIRFQISYFFK